MIFLVAIVIQSALGVRFSTHNVTGANGNAHHCRDIRDAHNLILLPELPRARSIFFEFDSALRTEPHSLRSSLLHSLITYSIDVPYLAFDARYRFWFESKRGGNANSNCSSDVRVVEEKPADKKPSAPGFLDEVVADNQIEQSDWSYHTGEFRESTIEEEDDDDEDDNAPDRKWRHAPNAAYPLALDNPELPAYRVEPDSMWEVQQNPMFPCSSVRYTAKTSFDELRACEALAVTSLANDTVRVASHTLVVGLATPFDENFGVNRIPVHIYADKYDNFARIVLINGVSLGTTPVVNSATLRHMTIDPTKDDRLLFTLLLQSEAELHANMLMLHSINDAGIVIVDFGTIEKPSQPGAPFLHFVDFASNTTVGVIEDKLTLDVRLNRHVHHSDICSVIIDLLVTNPRSLETVSSGDLHPLMTNHVVLYNGRGLVERDVKIVDGSQVCMINNVVMPEKLFSVVAIRIAEAWLCAVPKSVGDNTERLHCESQRHTVQLFKDGKANPEFNVSIVSPGRLGPSSIELCFSTSFEITDDDSLTLQAPVQRYESRIELVPRTKLSGEPSLYESLEKEEEFGAINAKLRNHSSQVHAYSQYHVQRAIRKVGHSNSEFHVRSLEFGVTSTLGTKHNMSAFASNTILLLVFVMFFCVIAAYCFLSAFDWQAVFRRQTFAQYYRK